MTPRNAPQPKNALAQELFAAAAKRKGKSPWVGQIVQYQSDEETDPAFLAMKARLLNPDTPESKPKGKRKTSRRRPSPKSASSETQRYQAHPGAGDGAAWVITDSTKTGRDERGQVVYRTESRNAAESRANKLNRGEAVVWRGQVLFSADV